MKKFLPFIILIVLVSCSTNKYISLVRNGKYFETQYTIDEVFYRCFNTCTWSTSRNHDDGKIYVTFKGKALVDGRFQLVKVDYRIIDREHFEVADFYINEDAVLSIEFIELVANLYYR